MRTSARSARSGDADTLLDSAARWEARIEELLAQVEAAAMPLGEPPLSRDDIDRIRAWQAAGFP